MKKSLIIIFLYLNLAYAEYSNYPLGFSFEEEELFISHLSVIKDINTTDSNIISIVFKNNQDKLFIVKNNISSMPKSLCNVHTIYELDNIQDSNFSLPCKRSISFTGKRYKKITINKFTIFLYKNDDIKKSIVTTAFLFKEGKFISTISSTLPTIKFENILMSIKENTNTSKDIQFYINNFYDSLNKGASNSSFKNLICVYILDSTNKELKTMYQKLTKLKLDEIERINIYDYQWKLPSTKK